MSSFVSSQHPRPPNYLPLAREQDDLLLREWLLVLRGDGKSAKTIAGYRESVGLLSRFLASGGYPLLASVSAEHLREWLGDLRAHRNKPSTVNTRYRATFAFFKWLVRQARRGTIRSSASSRRESRRPSSLTTLRRTSSSSSRR